MRASAPASRPVRFGSMPDAATAGVGEPVVTTTAARTAVVDVELTANQL
jgi:hypothetical protein